MAVRMNWNISRGSWWPSRMHFQAAHRQLSTAIGYDLTVLLETMAIFAYSFLVDMLTSGGWGIAWTMPTLLLTYGLLPCLFVAFHHLRTLRRIIQEEDRHGSERVFLFCLNTMNEIHILDRIIFGPAGLYIRDPITGWQRLAWSALAVALTGLYQLITFLSWPNPVGALVGAFVAMLLWHFFVHNLAIAKLMARMTDGKEYDFRGCIWDQVKEISGI